MLSYFTWTQKRNYKFCIIIVTFVVQLNASQHIVDAIKSVHGTRYLYGTVSDLVGELCETLE